MNGYVCPIQQVPRYARPQPTSRSSSSLTAFVSCHGCISARVVLSSNVQRTPELLAQHAQHYGMSVEEYKRRNLLRTEIPSTMVGEAVATLCSQSFAATTGAQIPIDGGNERVI